MKKEIEQLEIQKYRLPVLLPDTVCYRYNSLRWGYLRARFVDVAELSRQRFTLLELWASMRFS